MNGFYTDLNETQWTIVRRCFRRQNSAGDRARRACALRQHGRWQLIITKRGQRSFKIKGLTWIVERSFAGLGRNRRFGKDYDPVRCRTVSPGD